MRKNLYLDSVIVAEAQAEADRRERSLSDFVEISLREKLNRLRRPALMQPVAETAQEAVEGGSDAAA